MPREHPNPATDAGRSSDGAARTAQPPATSPALISLLAVPPRLIDLLPHLHQYAIDATGGRCSLLFEHNPRNGVLQATSGFGLDALPHRAVDAGSRTKRPSSRTPSRRAEPAFVADAERHMPDLAARLEPRAALLLPLVRGHERIGMLAVGFDSPARTVAPADVTRGRRHVPDGARAVRLRQREELQRDLRELLDEFSQSSRRR